MVLPKTYRRQATWAVNQRAGMTDLSFLDDLAGAADPCFELGAADTKRHLSEYVRRDRRVVLDPLDVVFEESPCELLDARGRVVRRW